MATVSATGLITFYYEVEGFTEIRATYQGVVGKLSLSFEIEP